MSAARTRARFSGTSQDVVDMALPASAVWGNRLGWLIAVALLGGLALLLVVAYLAGGRTGRTALSQDPQNLQVLALPIRTQDLDRIAAATTPGDGGSLLRRVTAQVVADPGMIDDWLARGGRADPQTLEPLLAQAREAAAYTQITLFPDPSELLVYPRNDTRRELRAIKDVGKALLHAGLLREAAGAYDLARADYEAAFLLGRRLFEQRLVEEQLTYGVRLMREAAEGLAATRQAAGGDATLPRAVADALKAWQINVLEPMRQAFVVEDASITGTHVGDYIALVEHSQEPVWRIESVMTLGRHRFNALRKPDQLAADAQVRRLADTAPDVHVRQAAQAARDLDLAGHRMVRFGSY